jgi:hypothetical protein
MLRQVEDNMSKFTFFVTRDITESAQVDIEAATIEEAHEVALHENWQTDDYVGKCYIPDTAEFAIT